MYAQQHARVREVTPTSREETSGRGGNGGKETVIVVKQGEGRKGRKRRTSRKWGKVEVDAKRGVFIRHRRGKQ